MFILRVKFIIFDFICLFFSLSYFTKMTESGGINVNVVQFDLFIGVALPLIFIQFKNRFFQSLGHTLCFFLIWIWVQQEIFTDSFFNTYALAIIIPIIFFIILLKVKVNPVFLRGGIYSYWILNIFHVLWVKKENALNHTFGLEDAAYAVQHWWFMLAFILCLYYFTKPSTMNKRVKNREQKSNNTQQSSQQAQDTNHNNIDNDYLNAGKK